MENIWQTGLYRYTDQKWNQTVDLMEEALRLFNIYENQTILCLKECQTGGIYTKLSLGNLGDMIIFISLC